MEKHKFSISISGTPEEAKQKVQGLAILAARLDAATITSLARVVENEPAKVLMAKRFLGIR